MSARQAVFNEWRLILIGLYFFVLPFGNSFQAIGILMSLIGIADVARGKVSLKQPVFKWLLLLFALYWVPTVVSLIYSLDFNKSVETVLLSLRYLFMAIFIIRSIKSRYLLSFLNIFLFSAVSFWLLDATVQIIFGVNLFDRVLESYASGPFEESSLGVWLVILALPYFSSVKDVFGEPIAKKITPFLGIWYVAVLILSNDIYGYVFLFAWLGVSMLYMAQSGRKLIVPAICAVICLAAQFGLKQSLTIEQLLNATSTNVERTHLWPDKKQEGLDVEQINGFFGSVGVRATRHEFPQFTGYSAIESEANPLLTRPMQFLEVRLETGWFGLVFLVLMVGYLIYRSRFGVERGYLGWLFAALLTLFPLSVHMSFYGSYWSTALWVMIALQLAVCQQNQNRVEADKLKQEEEVS